MQDYQDLLAASQGSGQGLRLELHVPSLLGRFEDMNFNGPAESGSLHAYLGKRRLLGWARETQILNIRPVHYDGNFSRNPTFEILQKAATVLSGALGVDRRG
jgi:hypothetical protein